MSHCLLIGFVLGLCVGSLNLAWNPGVLFAGIESLLCYLISAVCFSTLALLDTLKRREVLSQRPPVIVKRPAEERY